MNSAFLFPLFFQFQESIAAHESAFHMLTGIGRSSTPFALLDNLEFQPTIFTDKDLAFFHLMAVDHSNLQCEIFFFIITTER